MTASWGREARSRGCVCVQRGQVFIWGWQGHTTGDTSITSRDRARAPDPEPEQKPEQKPEPGLEQQSLEAAGSQLSALSSRQPGRLAVPWYLRLCVAAPPRSASSDALTPCTLYPIRRRQAGGLHQVGNWPVPRPAPRVNAGRSPIGRARCPIHASTPPPPAARRLPHAGRRPPRPSSLVLRRSGRPTAAARRPRLRPWLRRWRITPLGDRKRVRVYDYACKRRQRVREYKGCIGVEMRRGEARQEMRSVCETGEIERERREKRTLLGTPYAGRWPARARARADQWHSNSCATGM